MYMFGRSTIGKEEPPTLARMPHKKSAHALKAKIGHCRLLFANKIPTSTYLNSAMT